MKYCPHRLTMLLSNKSSATIIRVYINNASSQVRDKLKNPKLPEAAGLMCCSAPEQARRGLFLHRISTTLQRSQHTKSE